MTDDDASTRVLDHIVHLTPPGTLEESVNAFRNLGFTVTPGGTHAGGETANALVVFADGTYLELLHFTRPPAPAPASASAPTSTSASPRTSSSPSSTAGHPWAKKHPGWIDYAFLGNAGRPSVADTINRRADADGSGVRYARELRGGRKRAEDGRELEWLITAPEEAQGGGGNGPGAGEGARGRLPFFCGDVTPREWRVPLEPRSNTEHANTAQGVAYVKLLAPHAALDAYARQLTTIVGVPPAERTASQVVWELERQPSYRDSRAPHAAPVLILSAAGGEEEEAYVRTRGTGVYELGVVVEDVEREGGVVRTPYGRIVWRLAGGR
ncbi:glyoxalase-like domain-containing protein [Trametes punicea]|nr:glyoxalase-like domain-containing protein [Trametes punicea]